MKKIYLWIADQFKSLSRLFYSVSGGVCWYCGSRCGFDSCVARGKMWCRWCFDRNKRYLDLPNCRVTWQGIFIDKEQGK